MRPLPLFLVFSTKYNIIFIFITTYLTTFIVFFYFLFSKLILYIESLKLR